MFPILLSRGHYSFQNVFDLAINVVNFDLTFSTKIWLISLTFTTFIFAGFLREKVCIYMCPYGRFQSAMIENNTNLVTYNHYRGEPRGKQLEQKTGDCIDCFRCVLVCPTGIDIRDVLRAVKVGNIPECCFKYRWKTATMWPEKCLV